MGNSGGVLLLSWRREGGEGSSAASEGPQALLLEQADQQGW
jgi:hypothetical protein